MTDLPTTRTSGELPDGVWVIAFDQDVFGIFWTKEAAEADLKHQIAAGGPAWIACEVEFWPVVGPAPHSDTR